jgi:hypothetical protein
MRHAHGLIPVGGDKGGVQADVANAAAGNIELRELARVQILGRRRSRKDALPDLLTEPLSKVPFGILLNSCSSFIFVLFVPGLPTVRVLPGFYGSPPL